MTVLNSKLERRYIDIDAEWLMVLSEVLDNAVRDNYGNITVTGELAKEISDRIRMVANRISISPPSNL